MQTLPTFPTVYMYRSIGFFFLACFVLSPSVSRIHMSRDLGCGRLQKCNLNLVFLHKQDPDHPSKENLMDLEVKVGYRNFTSGDTCLCTILKSGLTTR